MSRINTREQAAKEAMLDSGRARGGAPGALRVIGCRLLALGFVGGLGALLAQYPPGVWWMAAALAAYAALLWFKPMVWLFAVPALLPVLDFSAWTGWFFVREGDFLILATLAVGYWKVVPQRDARPLQPIPTILIGLLVCSYVISAWIGTGGLPAIDVNSFASYQTPFNSMRVFLGFAWAILLLPLLSRSLGEDAVNLRRYFFPGMVLGLGLAATIVIWERLAFPGLMDFASDYRVTGSFSDMHTGGAALDGFLTLTLPFAAVLVLHSRKVTGVVGAGLIFALGTYAMLVTFSRTTYLAFMVVMAIVLVAFICNTGFKAGEGKARLFASALVILLLAYVLMRVFASGGYRTLAAALGMFAAAFFAGAVDFRNQRRRAIAIGAAIICAATMVFMAWSPRSIYLSYSLATFLLGIGLLIFWAGRARRQGAAIVLISLPCLCLGMVLIGWHWGGANAATDALFAALAVACLIGYNKLANPPFWSLSKASVSVAVITVLALALAIPVIGNFYVKNRFSQIGNDMQTRISHWRDVVGMIDPGWVTGAVGMGLGSFPQNYFWRNSKGELPGVHVYRTEDANTYLRLGGPRYEIGYGELLRVFQTVELQPNGKYLLSFDVRSNAKNAVISVGICEKWLLYPIACGRDQLSANAASESWTHVEKVVHSREFGKLQWFGKRPIHLSIAAGKAGTYVDVDNLALRDESGRDLIRNGTFSSGHDWWYFSSDHHHLPWHAKNMLLHVLFEQGWFGVALVSMLILYGLHRSTRRVLRRDLFAAATLAALAGFLVLGVFDALLDIPRLTLLFYLVLFVALLSETGRSRTQLRQQG